MEKDNQNNPLESIDQNTELALLQGQKIIDSVDNLEPIMEGVLVKTDELLNEQKKTNELLQNKEESTQIVADEMTVTVKGLKGEKGDKGDKGDAGEQGIQGEKGDKGDQGIAGIDGINGKDGKDGKDGRNGVDGKDGKNGAKGAKGDKGKDGDEISGETIKEKLESLDIGLNYDSLFNRPNIEEYIQRIKTSSRDYNLSELKDVAIGSQTNGQALLWNSTTSKWYPGTVASGGGTWGSITGTLSNQTDLQAALDAKGTVNSVSVVSANGFSGTVATSTTTPAITLGTTVTGLLYGNGTALGAVAVDNGLTYSAGTLKWGGALTADTTISGAFNLTFSSLVATSFGTGEFTITGANDVMYANSNNKIFRAGDFNGSTAKLNIVPGSGLFEVKANTTFQLKTPAVVAGTATVGQVLQLTNATTGASEWTTISTGSGTVNSGTQYQMAFYAANGTAVSGNSGITTDALNMLSIAPTAGSGTLNPALRVTSAAHTALTASTEYNAILFNGGTTQQFATGALTLQRYGLVNAPTYAGVGAMTITDAATWAVSGAPTKGTNVTLTNTHGILISSGAVSTATNSYGLTVNAQTGATNNYAAVFLGGNVGIGTASPAATFDIFAAAGAANSTLRFRDGDMTNTYTGLPGSPAFVSDEVMRFGPWSVGGLFASGFAGGTNEPGVAFAAYTKTSPTAPAVLFGGFKPNGASRTGLTGTEKVFMVQAGLDTTWAAGLLTILANGNTGLGITSPTQLLHLASANTIRMGAEWDLTNNVLSGVAIADLKGQGTNPMAFRVLPGASTTGYTMFGESTSSFFEVHRVSTGTDRLFITAPTTAASGYRIISYNATPRPITLGFSTNATSYTAMATLTTVGVAIGSTTTVPTAQLHLSAGKATASTAPLKFTSGTLNTTAEAGAVEFLTDKYYATITTGTARKEITLNDAALTSGTFPIATTNGRLTDSSFTSTNLVSGTYTPTLTGVTNVTGTTTRKATYMRVGNTVTVAGQFDITPTGIGLTVVGISLPVSSNFGTAYEAGGTGHTPTVAGHGASVYADATNNRAELSYVDTVGSADTMTYTFTYEVI